jgi:hypothetical protein
MSDPTDVEAMKRDLHGEQVGTDPICDFCDGEVDIDEPVMYDALHVVDLPNIEQLFDPPSEWLPDALRCHACEIEALDPATKGLDEACLIVHLNESNGVFSIDASSVTVVAVSAHTDGYHAPMVNPMLMSQTGDLGLARWIRVQWFVNNSVHPLTDDIWKEMVERSKEVPPDL